MFAPVGNVSRTVPLISFGCHISVLIKTHVLVLFDIDIHVVTTNGSVESILAC